MSYATLNDTRITKASIVLAYVGVWIADVTLDTVATLPSTGLTLVFGSLVMTCAVKRTGKDEGASAARLYGGAGGWRKELPPKQYLLAGGVKLKLVVGDAAAECGESVEVLQDRSLGTGFIRDLASAGHTLNTLAPTWYVRADGKTIVGDRVTTPITSKFSVLNFDRAHGLAELSTDAPEDWTPGRIFEHSGEGFAIKWVRHAIDQEKTRTHVMVQ